MSGLKVGLVASGGEESEQLSQLLEQNGASIVHNISPDNISDKHVEDEDLHVWLLYVDDDSWHDAIDHLLDESEIPVYFSEPGTLAKQSHPEYWCNNLLSRLFEITGIENDAESESLPETKSDLETAQQIEENEESSDIDMSSADTSTGASEVELSPVGEESASALSKSLDELEVSTLDLPDGIAAELVSELESISPVLADDIPHSSEQRVDSDATLDLDTDLSLESPALENIDLESLDTESLDMGSLDSEIIDTETIDTESFEPETIELETLELDTVDLGVVDSVDIESNVEASEFSGNDDVSEIELADFEETQFELEGEEQLNSSEVGAPQVGDSIDIGEVAEVESEIELATFENFDETAATDDSLEETMLSSEESAEEDLSQAFDNELQLDDEFSLELDGDLALDSEKHEVLSIEDEAESEENSDSQTQNFSDCSLSLESIEDEAPVISGRATYEIDDDEDEIVEQQVEPEDSFVEQEETGLSLEAIDEEKPITGKASYVIDEGDSDDILPSAPEKSEVQEKPPEPVAEDDFSLSLEPMEEEQQQSDWLIDEQEQQLLEETDLPQEPTLETEGNDLNELSLEPGDSAEVTNIDNDAEGETLDFSAEEELSLDEEMVSSLTLEDETNEALDLQVDDSDVIDVNDVSTVSEQQLIDAEVSSGIEIDEDAIREIAREALTEDSYEPMPEPLIEDELMLDENGQIEIQDEPITPSDDETDTSLEFEIPMLDETAVNVEFEERVLPQYQEPEYTPCWVIGASLGGPAAVKRFLNGVPGDINAGFIIAQHIDENFLPVLAEILTSSSQFNVTVAQGSNDIKPGSVYLAPLKGKLVFLKDGSMLVDHSQKWSAPYSPCIDDVIEGVSQVYGDKSGAIIFSGMGEDGLNGARKMRQQGGQVWAQSPDTCANASMPESVINNGEVDYVGTPEQLAERLVGTLVLASTN